MQGASGKLSPSAVCWTVCSCRAVRSTKRSPHHTHLNCVSRECTLWCLARCSRCLKLLSQLAHLKGFSPVAYCCLKLIWHSSHWKGRSSEWVRSCCRKSDGRLKLFPQEPHRKGLSPSELCVRWWWAR
uniref:Secreted protein n=1 Tax=Anabas testudineus TaxID=64144 RepID=A0AAQ6IH58_ANATE